MHKSTNGFTTNENPPLIKQNLIGGGKEMGQEQKGTVQRATTTDP
uniref:Uncharacterized protein n=1 Tax=Anguilla anguilla TaxID=7936 RepID=A0A0E9XBV0_ANGAN